MSHRSTRNAALASLSLLGALALASCSGSVTGTPESRSSTTATPTAKPGAKGVDTKRLERAIAASVRAQRHEQVSVTCPPEIDVVTGGHFYCAAQAGGEATPFLVTRRASGKLVYRGISIDKAPSVDMPGIEIQIAEALRAEHKTATSVLCPQEMPIQQGLVFVCAVTTGPKKPTHFIVQEVNSLGRVVLRAA